MEGERVMEKPEKDFLNMKTCRMDLPHDRKGARIRTGKKNRPSAERNRFGTKGLFSFCQSERAG